MSASPTLGTLPDNWRAFIDTHCPHRTPPARVLRAIEARIDTIERSGVEVFPSRAERYRAFELVDPEAVRVVIVGQDPYPGVVRTLDGRVRPQAHGLAFSIERDCALPRSLVRLFSERKSDLGIEFPMDGDLSAWASQGVLLLNTVLSVERDAPGSHSTLGWKAVTSAVIEALSRSAQGVVFVLLGGPAQKMLSHIERGERHRVIELDHPVARRGGPRAVKGSRLFSRVNDALLALGRQPVRW